MQELHPFIAGLLDFWHSKCLPGEVPQRAEFDAFALRPWLGWLAIYEELDGGADFLVRLDGTSIVTLTGQEWTGRRMSELDPRVSARVLEVLRRAVRERRPVVDRLYSPAAKDFLAFQRVTLPVREGRRGVWQLIQGLQPAPGSPWPEDGRSNP